MSNLFKDEQISDSKKCPPSSLHPTHKLIPTRKATIGKDLTIRRALPHPEQRMIGAWCFFDHFGPLDLKNSNGLKIPPHPHMGLQTFTWTIQGEILHRDSLGSSQKIHTGQVNLMTAGKGISHSEESLPDTTLHGAQLWIALPDSVRNMAPEFKHYPKMPILNHQGLHITLLAGEFLEETAPTECHTPLIGLDIRAIKDTEAHLPLNPEFEYGVLPLINNIHLEGKTVDTENLLYLGTGRSEVTLQMKKGSHALMIGGEPFKEEVLLWWNFVARTKQEMIDATNDWEQKRRFGTVKDYPGERLIAPKIS